MKKLDSLSLLVFVRNWGITVLLVLLLALFSIWAAPVFGTLDNFSLILGNASIGAIFAAAIAMGVFSGALDLSVPGTAAIAGITAGLMINAGQPVPIAIAAALIVGIVIGAFNGLVSLTGLNPLVVTIGTLSITSGVAAILTGGMPLYGLEVLAFMGTDTYFKIGTDGEVFAGIPATFFVVLIVYVLGTIFLTKTRGGVRFLAAGGNAEALRRVGVNANLYRVLGFVLSGLLAALGGLVTAAYTSGASPAAATGVLFDGLTAVALSGISLAGGRGSLPKVLVGALVIATIASGLLILNIEPFWTVAITGVMLIAALAGEHAIGKAVAKKAVTKSTVSAHKESK
ncbi:MAG: hypothetical protein RIR16_430 [Actinomycetota bacterium]|jgi:ribose transport system permease protein